MPIKEEIAIITKAAVFDLKLIIKGSPNQTFTREELDDLLDAYAIGVSSNPTK